MANNAPVPEMSFSLSQRIQLAIIPRAMAGLFSLLYRSCRVEVRGLEFQEEALAGLGRCHMAIWHEAMALAGCYYSGRDYVSMVSRSYDGEFAARVLGQWRIGAARGSSSRGGSEALNVLVEAARTAAITGLTLDGPKGPRRVAKPGIAILAARTGLPIVPNVFGVERAWHLHSWDRLPIQKPFSRIVCIFGESVPPPSDDSPELVELTRAELERRMNVLQDAIDLELGGA